MGHDQAIDKGRTVAWHTPETLAQLLRCHRVDDSVNKVIGKLIRVDLVVIDDVGLLPISTDAAEALFRVVDAAYEKRSIAISSNIHPSGFDELMPKSLATATVERLLHHAHVLITDGQDSYRLAHENDGIQVQHAPKALGAAFAGRWEQHESTLVIAKTGNGRMNYADLARCPSCSFGSAPRGTLNLVFTSVTKGRADRPCDRHVGFEALHQGRVSACQVGRRITWRVSCAVHRQKARDGVL
jgi:hypothetical protein